MATEKVLSFEREGQVGPELLTLRALGDAIAAIGVAGDMAALLDGTLVNLGYLIIEKTETVGEALGVMDGWKQYENHEPARIVERNINQFGMVKDFVSGFVVMPTTTPKGESSEARDYLFEMRRPL